MLKPKNDLLQGTLALLILKTLARGPIHGYGIPFISKRFQRTSCGLRKVPSIPRSTAWNRTAGFAQSGAARKTIAALATIV